MSHSMRWFVRDRYNNSIYLSQERWEHIIDQINHPEMQDYEEELQKTIQQGTRKQDVLVASKYRYTMSFSNLVFDNTHIVAIVLFTVRESESGTLEPNNYIVTAYQKEIR